MRRTGKSAHLDRPLKEILQRRMDRWKFEVGILEDGPHYAPLYGKKLKTYAGGPARRRSRTQVNGTLSSVSKDVRKHLGFNYLTRPFAKRTDDRIKFVRRFLKMTLTDSASSRESSAKRVENLFQAVVRNPILRGDYGRNRRAWAKIKGFNRKLIDTAQFFKAIKARVARSGVSR